MRIVYYLPDIDAGVSRIVKNLLQYRQKITGVNYAVVLFRRNDQNEKDAGTDFNADEIIRFKYREEENAFTVFKRLSKTLKSEKDVIVGNDGFEIKMVATMRLKNPVVYIMHGDFIDYYIILKYYHTVINCIIAYSNKIEMEVKLVAGVEVKKVHKIYYPSAAVANLPNRKEQSGLFKIVFAGFIIERKGADLLPKIYNQLISLGMDNFELEIIGEGELLPEMKAAFDDKRNVILPGWSNQEYVNKQMKDADVFLFPSRREGLPNVLVEAMAAGAVPVVSNLESGVSDIVLDDFNGLLVATDDVNGFADAVFKLYKNKIKLKELAGNGIESVSKFEPIAQAKAYEDLIIETGTLLNDIQRIYPRYKRGRVLDIKWIPGCMVFMARKIFKNPKL